MSSFNPLGSILQVVLGLAGKVSDAVTAARLAADRHVLSRLRDSFRKQDEGNDDTSATEDIVNE